MSARSISGLEAERFDEDGNDTVEVVTVTVDGSEGAFMTIGTVRSFIEWCDSGSGLAGLMNSRGIGGGLWLNDGEGVDGLSSGDGEESLSSVCLKTIQESRVEIIIIAPKRLQCYLWQTLQQYR
jgi:hypothetical protein